ncbi:ABC-type multidrug transport system fused ATPase/permease subunit [Streptomyces achromogenes]|uniref:ATP-binding cassette domain-containing protein n=1 Tax=Streptomyces achromogenes TaxID=67255 RepID=UPI00277F39C0|nr:ABC transporter ATP-binding protein [Streptomyces achromogenes]MDQ0835312.1 ABC-type multidrug transport system fused ATPase/permease subunit [Streptomyces achromogenes]
MSTGRGGRHGFAVRAGRFLARRRWALVRLTGWSVLEAGQTFLLGYALARALDDGFLAGRADVGLWWLGAAGLGVLAGAYGTARVYGAVAALVEPLRDGLVAGVVRRGVREADRGALSGLTQQVEIARDAFAGLIMVSRSFVFTSVGALAGLSSLAPPLLLVVAPPLAAGVALFAVTLGPLARRQEAFLRADEALAKGLGTVCPGLRDVTAAGAEDRIAAETAVLVDAELRAARALARWGVARVVCLALGGHLPLLLLLAGAPWLLAHDVTPGALVGALAYVTQSLLPALTGLIHGLGTSGSRLTVVLRRLAAPEEKTGTPPPDGAGRPTTAPPPHHDPPPTPPLGPANSSPHGPADVRAVGGAPSVAALSLDALSFAYGPASAPVVDGLTLSLPAGAHLAVAGPSGVGKSTLTGLVAGLLTPVGGEIRICGRPVPGAEAAARRVLIPQEAYVFGGTLGENLGHLRPDPVPEEELRAAAAAVGLAPLMDALGGPGAWIDPAALSAGERQLIALTRAYLSSAPLALLDEATCHLDPEAEARAERAFAARPGGTLVVVAHRVSSALRADRVLVMDGPRTTYGTHDEVLRRSPLYRDLVAGWTAADGGTAGDGGRASQPALPLRDADGVDAVARAGLAGDRRHVVAHGPVGQVQAPGDLRDGGALGGEGQHA